MRKSKTENREDFEAHVGALIEAAANYIDEDLGPERAQATNYYHGAEFGDEQDGRSRFVSRDVRDTVQAMLPSLLRVFFGPKHVLEFSPSSAATTEVAAQATDVVRHIVEVENPGFDILYSAIKDALIRRTGVLTWYYDDGVDLRFEEREGLSELDLMVLLDEEGVEVGVLKQYPDTAAEAQPAELDPMTGQPAPPPTLYDVRLRREAKRGKFVLAAIPPEEFIISRNARTIADADVCGWQRKLPEHELLAMGYSAEDIEPHLGHSELEDNEEVLARDPDAAMDLGELTPRALYGEFYTRYDYDGDGYPELRKVCVIGNNREILHTEYADAAPFSVMCPDPEPHRWVGSSIADNTLDIQRVKSYMIRALLDSLSQSVRPRMAVVDSQVNIEDLLNDENGGYVRMRQPGMVQPLDVPFVGQQVLPVLAYMDEVKENRTGISKAAAGLDADALQSSTRAAVAATVTASQQQIELVARLLAASLKPAFMGLYGLFKKHQDRARAIRLRGEWVEVDPRTWPAELDVSVNVALGDGDEEKKYLFLTQVAAKQEEILTTHGLSNPLVTLRQYRNTLGRLIQLGGYRDVGEFFNDIPADFQPPAPPAPPPDPAMAAVQLEAQVQQAKLALQAEVERAKDDRERDTAAMDFWLGKRDLELKYATQLDTAELKAEVERDRAAQQAAAQPAPGAAE
jgi:hypothetical protein